jgi:hypothetical protein
MTPEEERVADLVRRAFYGVTLGNGVGLLHGQGLDDYADRQTLAQYRAKDEKLDWTRIGVTELNRCHSSLSFFDAEGMRFHLPAYLIADLEGTLNQDIVVHLFYFEHGAKSRFALLDSDQRRAVRQFLLLRRSDRPFDWEMIDKALSGYWAET